MTFKEQLENDMNDVFFNEEEFSGKHSINGKQVLIIIDNSRLEELFLKNREHSDGIFTENILFIVRKSDLDFVPVAEKHIRFDDDLYKITDVKQDDSETYTIIIEAKES